jgi:hypothetical protein
MSRLDLDRQIELEPKRLAFAKRIIEHLGYAISQETKTTLRFEFKGEIVTLYPYSGWHTGKSIKDGRGLQKLLDQLTK